MNARLCFWRAASVWLLFALLFTACTVRLRTGSVAMSLPTVIPSPSIDRITISNLVLNGGAPSTTNNYVQLSFQASDNLNPITYFCFKSNSTAQPTLTDSCWTAVNALGVQSATTINVTNAPFLIGFASGAYSIYVYARDGAGNISSLSSSGAGTLGVDKQAVTYAPGAPPVLINVIAASSATPSEPSQTMSDLQASSGANVYIQWKISSAVNGLGSSPISISYLTNSGTGTVATGLINGANGCAPDTYHTGCYLWSGGSPTSSYFAVRVAATDNAGMVTISSSSGVNTWPPINFLAGNTDPGTGGSASAAVFVGNTSIPYLTDSGSLAVAENGTVYFRDINRGILVISPSNGVQKILVPLNSGNSSSFGDGGPVSAATVRQPIKITLDFNGNLLIWDYDRIRKVNTSVNPMTISTLIGGGASVADNVGPTQVQFQTGIYGPQTMVLFTLPNGDIYFQTEADGAPSTSANGVGFRVRVYKAALNQVQSIYFSGTGDSSSSSADLSTSTMVGFGVTYDPTSSNLLSALTYESFGSIFSTGNFNLSTWQSSLDPNSGNYLTLPGGVPTSYVEPPQLSVGHDGNLYASWYLGSLWKYSYQTGSWTEIVGTGTPGICADGTAATSCNITPNDIYVSAAGQIYYVDRGLIRTINSSGNVVTLMGQSFSFGDGGNALSARFNVVNSLGVYNSGSGDTVTTLDQNEIRFREFPIGGTINTIAGNGTNSNSIPYSTTTTASSISIQVGSEGSFYDDFRSDFSTGDILYGSQGVSSYLERLVRSTGLWTTLAGAGSTAYTQADGDTGASIDFDIGNPFFPRVIGWDGTNVLAVPQSYDGSNTNPQLKLYDGTTGLQNGLAGIVNNAPDGNTYCNTSSPVAASACTVPDSQGINQSQASYDSYASPTRWAVLAIPGNNVNVIDENFVSHTNTGDIYTLTTLSIYATSFFYRHDSSHNIVYYCGTDGKLHKNDISAGTDTTYSWPVESVECTGRSLFYSSTRNSLIFPYVQNGLYGVAEYTTP
jgi:hypothetical protein